MVAAYGLFGQSAERPRFAVASIKPNPATGPRSMEVAMGAGYRPGGRFVASNATVPFLIQRAYGVESFQLVGGPSWLRSDGYDIEAKPGATTDQPRMWLMVQTLLAERFKLAMRRETREMPVYDLQPLKNGLKPPLPERGQPRPAPPCGPGVVGSGTGLAMEGISVSMPALAKFLSALVGREVIDKTGFTGRFALHLEFANDDALAGLPNPRGPEASASPDGIGKPSLFSALQGQLGLKLESSKGPVDVFVIDHVEKPAEN
jgi:uncharacterized protein (TIGR03435 family)